MLILFGKVLIFMYILSIIKGTKDSMAMTQQQIAKASYEAREEKLRRSHEGLLTRSPNGLSGNQNLFLDMLCDNEDEVALMRGIQNQSHQTGHTLKRDARKKKRNSVSEFLDRVRSMEIAESYKIILIQYTLIDQLIADTKHYIATKNLSTKEQAVADKFLTKLESKRESLAQDGVTLSKGGEIDMKATVEKVKKRESEVKALLAGEHAEDDAAQDQDNSPTLAGLLSTAGAAAYVTWRASKKAATAPVAPTSEEVVSSDAMARAQPLRRGESSLPFDTSAGARRHDPVRSGDLTHDFGSEADSAVWGFNADGKYVPQTRPAPDEQHHDKAVS
jgi:hypothetical protein